MQTKNVLLTAKSTKLKHQGTFKTDVLKKGLIFLFLVTSLGCLFGQGELDEKTVLLLRNENTASFLLNTNGWGLNYRYAKRKSYFKRYLYEIDLVGIKDSKEIKVSSQIDSRSFVMGKLNSCYVLRFGYGYQKEIFSKFDKSGIAIRYFYTGGASFALSKPYYYLVWYKLGENNYLEKDETYNQATGAIVGRAPFSKGMDELKITPGLYARCGFSFDISRSEEVINALEIGAGIDIYPKKIMIMANDQNRWVFLSMFISYRFGKTIDNTVEKKKKTDFFDEQYF
jgi:hypothetical protein